MAKLDMTSLDSSLQLAKLDMMAGFQAPNAMTMPGHEIGAMKVLPYQNTTSHAPINEPTSLVLALIGIGTLLAYRGIQKTIAASVASKVAAPKLIKPRRAA